MTINLQEGSLNQGSLEFCYLHVSFRWLHISEAVGFFICLFWFFTYKYTHNLLPFKVTLHTHSNPNIDSEMRGFLKKNPENRTKSHILLNAHKKAWFLENVIVFGLKRLVLVSSQGQLPAVLKILARTTAEILLFVSLSTATIFFMTFLTRWSSCFSKCQIL